MITALRHVLAAIAATVGLVVLAGILQVTAFFINLLVPLPIVLLTFRRGALTGLLAVVATTAIFSLGADLPSPLLYLAQFGLVSVLFPHLLSRGWRWDRAAAVTLVALTAGVILTLAVQASLEGTTVNGLVKGFIEGEIGKVKAVYSQTTELTTIQREELLAALDQSGAFMASTWPAFVWLLGGALLLTQLLLLCAMPGTRSLVPGPAFIDWKAPELLVWPLLGAGFASVFAAGAVQTIAIALLIVLIPIYFLQGLAIVTFMFQRRGTPPWLRAIGYVLLIMLNPLPLMVAGLGLFDLWADFRKPRIEPNKE